MRLDGLPEWLRSPVSFRHRAQPHALPEHMDQPCAYEEFRDCLRDLDAANRWTLGARPTLAFLAGLPRQQTPLRILDVGYGSGAMLRRIVRWARRRRIAVELTGVDLNPHAALAAHEFNREREAIRFLTGDAYSLPPAQEFDVILSSLVAHHMEDHELVRFLGWMQATARLGWFVNDLHRRAAPYATFSALARVARWHPFVRHDGPVSIRRGFRPADWQRLCAAAGVDHAVTRRWAPWRLCVSQTHVSQMHVSQMQAGHAK